MANRTSGRSRSRRTQRRSILFVAPVVALLLALLALPALTTSGAPSLAQGTPESEETQETDETLTIQSQPGGTASITVNKYECLADYGNDKNLYSSYCFPPSGTFEFQVYGPNLTEFSNNGVTLTDVEAGVFSIREIIPQGWYPVVFCQISDSAPGDGGSQEVVIYDGYYEVEVLGGQYLVCDWYNIPPLKADLTVNKHFCPAVSEEFDAYEADIFELALECHEPSTPTEFTISQNGAEIGTETAEGDLPLATFSQIQPGQTTIVETIPSGYGEPIVYCSANDSLGNDISATTLAPIDNDRITWLVGNGHAVFCDWWNVPAEQYGSITLVKYTCPAATGYGGDDYEWYADRCDETTEGIPFKLDGASTGNPGSQETDANGQIVWDEREADTYYISEEEPEDGPLPYGRPVVYCSYYDPAALQDREYEEYELDDEGRIMFDLDEGQYIACIWFNMPEDEYGYISVYKYNCPEEWGYGGGSYDWYLHRCTEAVEGVSFKLDGDSTGNPGSQETDEDGQVSWNEREADTYYVTEEDVPSDYGKPVVYCSYYHPDSPDDRAWQEYGVDDEYQIQFDLAEQQYIECYWFNIYDDEYGSISILKITCPEHEGYGGGSYEWYAERCTEPTADVSFKLDGASTGNPGSQLTDEDGWVTWNEREADTYYVTEEEPEDGPSPYGEPVVYCYYYDPESPGTYEWDEYSTDDEGRIQFDLAYQQDFTCVWFNIWEDAPDASPSASPRPSASPSGSPRPSPSPGTTGPGTTGPGTTGPSTPTGPATLVIEKYLCEEGYDWQDEDADPPEDCEERPDGIVYELAPDGGSLAQPPREAETGEDDPGVATFRGITAGDYILTELELPEGYTAFILSCESSRRDFTDYPYWPFAYAAADGSVRLALLAGETLECEWYNVPPEPEEDGDGDGDGNGGGGGNGNGNGNGQGQNGLGGLRVDVYACEDDEQSPEACDPQTEPTSYVLTPVDGGDPETLETEDGSGSLTGLDGDYTITQVGQQPCVIESPDIDAQGVLSLSPDEGTLVRVYNCA